MKLPIRIRPEANDDIARAMRWYEGRVEGLGRRLLDELDAAFERIRQYPRLHAVAYRDVRLTLLRKFPYVVCYIAHDDEVEVLAVFHGHSDPDAWKTRLD